MIEAAVFTDQTGSVNMPGHTALPLSQHQQLSRRCALFALMAMSLSIGMGMLAWGPICLAPNSHLHAAHGIDVVLSLPMLLAGVCGWRVLGRSHWPAVMRTPWRWCFACLVLSAGLAVAHHLAPSDLGHLAEQTTAAGAFVMLTCGFLAERVDARFGSARAGAIALAVAGLAGLASWLSALGLGEPDPRPFLLLQLLPVLLIPAGVLGLPGSHTHRVDGLLVLGLCAAALGFDLGDGVIASFTAGAVSGHMLMHLCLACMVALWAYRAGTAASAVTAGDTGLSQTNTSLSTSG